VAVVLGTISIAESVIDDIPSWNKSTLGPEPLAATTGSQCTCCVCKLLSISVSYIVVLIIFPVILQTVINYSILKLMTVWRITGKIIRTTIIHNYICRHIMEFLQF